MKIYLVVYVAGKIIGFTGPVPYTMEDCARRALAQDEACIDGAFRCADIRHKCEYHTEAPRIDPGFIN